MTLVFDSRRFQQGVLACFVALSSMIIIVVGRAQLPIAEPQLIA
jgi:hypothetical protein